MAKEPDDDLDDVSVEDDELIEPSDEALLEDDDLDPDALLAGDLDDDDLDDAVDVDVDVDVDEAEGDGAVVVESEENLTDDDEDELDDDEVEASLDVILKERLVVDDEEDEEDEEDATDAEDRAEGTTRVLPKQPGEFVCQSCFLVKSETQLADPTKMLCRDCV